MKATIYIPKKLEQADKSDLEIYPEKTFSSLVQEAFEDKLMPRKNRLLELAGFVEFAPNQRSLEQMAEDEPTKRGH